ncbi:hypothetical protein K470DRAFT_260205 [Piedraia hortae CBS 480.64]|uniref:Zn(2)-C6 fungal-type domain-containing protein n=1 Tax=Piedraia hortae CBS 480.64 TaxID=1314780 RepID=A0A6A7BS49_9PEZI|nr:hypothetical protein K470DRAFT_260205 [Piedraia hortae CBS 480.64]
MPGIATPGAASLVSARRLPRKRGRAKGVSRSASTPQLRQTDIDAERRRHKLTYQRISVACGHCRHRKIRCLVAESDAHGRCQNCIRLNKVCVYYPVDQQMAMEGALEGRSGPSSVVSLSPLNAGTTTQAEPQRRPSAAAKVIAPPPPVPTTTTSVIEPPPLVPIPMANPLHHPSSFPPPPNVIPYNSSWDTTVAPLPAPEGEASLLWHFDSPAQGVTSPDHLTLPAPPPSIWPPLFRSISYDHLDGAAQYPSFPPTDLSCSFPADATVMSPFIVPSEVFVPPYQLQQQPPPPQWFNPQQVYVPPVEEFEGFGEG